MYVSSHDVWLFIRKIEELIFNIEEIIVLMNKALIKCYDTGPCPI